jgi:hypothetical protein
MALADGFDLLAVAPVRATGGVEATPVRLTNMLNAGGAVEGWALSAGPRRGGAALARRRRCASAAAASF